MNNTTLEEAKKIWKQISHEEHIKAFNDVMDFYDERDRDEIVTPELRKAISDPEGFKKYLQHRR